MGLVNRPEVQAAELDAKAAGTDVSVAKGGYYPSVSLSAGPTNSGVNGATYEVTAAQMLYDWGHVASQVEGARAVERQLSQDLLAKRDAAALDIVGTYLDVLDAEQQQRVDNEHIARLGQILQMTRTRSQSGYADTSEPARTNLELARARQQLAADEGKLRDAGNQFKLLVGQPPTQIEEPKPPSIAGYVAGHDLADIIAQAPLYRKAIEDMKYAEAQVDEARSSLLPQLNVEASTTREDIGGQAETQSFIGLRFRVNTLQGFSNFQRVDGARQRAASARKKADTVERDLRRQVQSLFDTASMLEKQEATLSDQVTRSAGLVSIYQEQFQVGHRDVIDLLNIQIERFQAERELVDLRMQRIRAQYQAAAQLGLIGPLLEGELPA